MSVSVQVSFDASGPRKLGEFWAAALGYETDPPPAGHESWEAFLRTANVPEDRWDDVWAIHDPSGAGPRILFQKVPEPKTSKNRVHLDVGIGRGIADAAERWQVVRAHVDALVAAGGEIVEDRSNEFGERWMVMLDPDGNEFCVQ